MRALLPRRAQIKRATWLLVAIALWGAAAVFVVTSLPSA